MIFSKLSRDLVEDGHSGMRTLGCGGNRSDLAESVGKSFRSPPRVTTVIGECSVVRR